MWWSLRLWDLQKMEAAEFPGAPGIASPRSQSSSASGVAGEDKIRKQGTVEHTHIYSI